MARTAGRPGMPFPVGAMVRRWRSVLATTSSVVDSLPARSGMAGVRGRPERDGHRHPALRLGAPAQPALPCPRARWGIRRDDRVGCCDDPFPRPAAAGERGGGGTAQGGVTAHPAGARAQRAAAADGGRLRGRWPRGVGERAGVVGARVVPGRLGTWPDRPWPSGRGKGGALGGSGRGRVGRLGRLALALRAAGRIQPARRRRSSPRPSPARATVALHLAARDRDRAAARARRRSLRVRATQVLARWNDRVRVRARRAHREAGGAGRGPLATRADRAIAAASYRSVRSRGWLLPRPRHLGPGSC